MRSLISRAMIVGILSMLMFFFLLGGPSTATAEETEDRPTATLYVDFLNQYVWRGYALSDEAKGMVIQPSMTFSYKGFSLNLWGNFDTHDHNPVGFEHDPAWNETDFTFSYSREVYKNLTANVGVIYYALDKVDDSFEVYLGASYALPWFTVGLTGYREVSHYPGWWAQLDLTRNFKLPCYDMSIDVGSTFIYQDSDDKAAYPDPDNFDHAFSGPLSGTVSAALNIPVAKYFTISPKVGYAFPLGGDAADLIEGLSWDRDDDHLFGGIRITAAF